MQGGCTLSSFLTIFFFLFFAIPLCVQIFLNFCIYTNFVFDICLLLAAINSSSNPIIYVLGGNYKKQNFRESVKMALQRVFEDRADPWMVAEAPVSRITYSTPLGRPASVPRSSTHGSRPSRRQMPDTWVTAVPSEVSREAGLVLLSNVF